MASLTSKPPSKPVQALKRLPWPDHFRTLWWTDELLGQLFLTGFNYTRMIFCVKVISKNGHKKTRISGFFHHKQIFIIRICYLFIANQLLRSLFVIHGRDTLLFLCQFSACRPGLQTEEPEPVHLSQQLPVW